MTEEQINIAIAEVCGWKFVWRHNDSGWDNYTAIVTDPCGKFIGDRNEIGIAKAIPDYCHDLNAMREAAATLTQEEYDGLVGFTAYLARVTQGAASVEVGWKFRPMQEATARQRAEAFLRVKGLWRDTV